MNTKKYILEAAKELYATTDAKNITVEMIANKAEVSKSTFYRHFYDKYQVIDYYFDLILEEKLEVTERDSFRAGHTFLLDSIYKDKKLFRRLFSTNNSDEFKKQFVKKTNKFVTEYVMKAKDIDHLSDKDIATIMIYNSGMFALIEDWCRNDYEVPVSRLAGTIYETMPYLLLEK